MKREFGYQSVLIALGIVAALLLGVFFFREIFPEYKIYQNDFVELEQFRSRLTGKASAPFKEGVKQIVIERDDRGPPVIDRCTSCHVALQIEAYSPTRLVKQTDGSFKQEENPDYVWKLLAEKDPEKYKKLKTVQVGEAEYDVEKVLAMHPLIGKETRPFQYHPIEEWGCTSCHGGNGRGLVTDRAHGPVLDGKYEKEEVGFVPQFLESDPVHDPKFSKVFNHKPGHRLLFQTTPIYVGALMQAKCAQCHEPSKGEGASQVDGLLKNYERGQELFISQGCYACHRIAGYTRGGVGPELTRSGESYPWFVKESIVWPQADLKTSTMPNLRLDHQELEDLVTYLLGQTGKKKSESEIGRKVAIQEWEAGKKLPFEQPVPEKEIHNVRYGMTIFATEGCASCHRLRGFDSDVGFAVEKEKSPDPMKLAQEREWFSKLIPEDLLGSSLIKVLENQGDEIDRRIISGVRKGSLLEEIEKAHPDLLESFYSNFKFASRAHEDASWKERLQRVLKMYIQVYGLGRLICPRPNWSGIYRSDEWLMEHFKSPTSRVPRSIMPVFPFDSTKFQALTYMLDEVGLKNNAFDREIVKAEGFSPAKAYMQHCAQCHGEARLGNGPVAAWIYPIPKNLNNAEFMRNLTKERVVQSIMHGVSGTPMAPWGELGSGKPFDNKNPVMTESEIRQLADWLFASLPGSTIIRGDQDILKWNYTPEDVMKELSPQSQKSLFDQLPDHQYYLERELYTPANIAAGQAFFVENCAQCHGKEGDGAGLRAEAMQDAKPRMLINLDWLKSRDDLRLLQSIKYGVPGTSMTPWGDLTTSLQRIQLVLFIRSLSEDNYKRRMLSDALYDVDNKAALQSVGNGFLSLGADRALIQTYVDLIKGKTRKEVETLAKEIEQNIKSLEMEKAELEGKLDSPEKRLQLQKLDSEISAWKKQKELFLTTFTSTEQGKTK